MQNWILWKSCLGWCWDRILNSHHCVTCVTCWSPFNVQPYHDCHPLPVIQIRCILSLLLLLSTLSSRRRQLRAKQLLQRKERQSKSRSYNFQSMIWVSVQMFEHITQTLNGVRYLTSNIESHLVHWHIKLHYKNDYNEGYIYIHWSNRDNCTHTSHDSGLVPCAGMLKLSFSMTKVPQHPYRMKVRLYWPCHQTFTCSM